MGLPLLLRVASMSDGIGIGSRGCFQGMLIVRLDTPDYVSSDGRDDIVHLMVPRRVMIYGIFLGKRRRLRRSLA
jgi:hypothetical protein